MNSVELANNLIYRAKNIQKFTVETEVDQPLAFNGEIPFDISIKDGILSAEIYAIDFDEACQLLNKFLEDCQ
jgi:hypothetical protein